VADDYRGRYLETERVLIQLKEASKRDREEAVRKAETRLSKLIEEERQEYLRRL
jgi:hypothetical protein